MTEPDDLAAAVVTASVDTPEAEEPREETWDGEPHRGDA